MARPVIAVAAAGTAAAPSLPSRPGGRRPELDVARALVVAGLVVFHSAMVFGTSWFVNVPRPNIGFGAFLVWGALLGMPFLTGLVLLVPPMFYLEHLAQPGFHQPYERFWLAFLNVPAIARGLLPRGNWTSA